MSEKQLSMYNETVMEHFLNPRNVGEIENPDAVGEVGSAACGDIMKITLKIENDRIVDIKFKTFGCASAIASTSVATEMIKGKTLEEAAKLTNQDVVNELGGLPAIKIHCSVLMAETLEAALKDYERRQKDKVCVQGPQS